MSVAEDPVIDEVPRGTRKRGANGGQGFTKVSWVPDLARLGFHQPEREADEAAVSSNANANANAKARARASSLPRGLVIDDDNVAALRRRVVDVAACLADANVAVSLNGEAVPVQSFKDFMALFGKNNAGASSSSSSSSSSGSGKSATAPTTSSTITNMAYERLNDRWEVGVLPVGAVASSSSSSSSGIFGGSSSGSGSSGGGGGVQHVSFVNSMATARGGTHVGHVASQLVKRLGEQLERRRDLADLDVTPQLIRSRLLLFVNASIENPAFDSQMKVGSR